MEEKDISIHVFSELLKTVELLKIDGTIKCLQDARLSVIKSANVESDFFINKVSEITGTPVDVIMNGRDKTDERKIALSLCVFYIKEAYSCSLSDLSKVFNKDKAALSRYYNNAASVNIKRPKGDFNEKMAKYMTSLNLIFNSIK